MHELGIAMELLRACRAELDARGGGRLTEVCVQIGELTGVEPALLRTAWTCALQGSDHDGAALVIEHLSARQRCDSCGDVADRQPGTWLRLCPTCQGPLRLDGGRQLDIVRIRFEACPLSTEVVR